MVTLVSAGSTDITAGQDGNATYNPAYTVQTLTVNKATLTVTADNKSKTFGTSNPMLTFVYSGFIGSDNASVLSVLPTSSTTALPCSNTGTYPITITPGSANNYNMVPANGTLTITKATLNVKADGQSKSYGSPNPPLTFTYLNFLCQDNPSVIDTPPNITTTATQSSPPGAYPITLSGGSDNNYALTLIGDSLRIIANVEALTFNGDAGNQYVKIPETNGRFNLGTGPFVLEAYCKATTVATTRTLLSKRTYVNGSLSDGFLFGIWTDGRPFLQLKGSPNILPPSNSAHLFDGVCHWVAVRRSGTTISFFVDGAYIGNGNSTSNRNISSTGPLQIASDPPVTTVPFSGWIGEVRIWNISLTNAQIASNSGIVLQPQTGLMGYYTMTDPMGSQVLTDISTANASLKNNGTLGATSAVEPSDPAWLTNSQITCGASGGRVGPDEMFVYDYVADTSRSNKKTSFDFDENEFINIYPNPTSGEFHLRVNPSEEPFDLKIYDALGKEILSRSGLSPGDDYLLGVGWVAGVYIIKIQQSASRRTFKVVIH
jgi:hypothetical protein